MTTIRMINTSGETVVMSCQSNFGLACADLIGQFAQIFSGEPTAVYEILLGLGELGNPFGDSFAQRKYERWDFSTPEDNFTLEVDHDLEAVRSK